MSTLVLLSCSFGREKVHKVDVVFTFVAGDKLLDVSVKKLLVAVFLC